MPAEERPRQRLSALQIAAVASGNALEFYDFVTYSFFAIQIGRTLFPGDASESLILSLATFGVGFVSRPLGGLIIGRMADRRGRKPAKSRLRKPLPSSISFAFSGRDSPEINAIRTTSVPAELRDARGRLK